MPIKIELNKYSNMTLWERINYYGAMSAQRGEREVGPIWTWYFKMKLIHLCQYLTSDDMLKKNKFLPNELTFAFCPKIAVSWVKQLLLPKWKNIVLCVTCNLSKLIFPTVNCGWKVTAWPNMKCRSFASLTLVTEYSNQLKEDTRYFINASMY